jgi:putative hydrolase of the HAD superfamily
LKMVLLDVDDTLYPKGTGPFAYVNRRIDTYVMSLCRVDLEGAHQLRRTYIQTYGSTMQGLMRDYGIDPGHYLEDVHDVPVEDLLKKDPRLRDALKATGNDLVVFSNGSFNYAYRILRALGIADLIFDMFTIEYMDFIPKPLPWPYYKVMGQYGREPHEYLVVDDRISNIRTALDMGMSGVVIGNDDLQGKALSIPSIYEIPRAVERDCQ